MTKALVVLSGGQDSVTCLFWARQHFDEVHAITFDYRQRHSREIAAAKVVAMLAGVESHEIAVVPKLAGSSPLTDANAELETYRSFQEMDATIGDRVELTFVPMRNAVFLALAMNRAAALGCDALVTGVCQADNANYPDCRRSFIEAFEEMTAEALGRRIKIEAPLLDNSKAQTVALALSLPGCYRALAFSHTAYSGEYPPTTQDHATVLRAEGFRAAGIPDPLIVRAHLEGLALLPEEPNYSVAREAKTLGQLCELVGARAA